jgi:pantetheine-phosphate adenylyltransferase
MTKQSHAIFSGTFDPVTLGHEDLITRAAAIFPKLTIAVAYAHHKKTLFSLEERLAMLRERIAHLPHVSALAFEGLIKDFAVVQGANVIVRGVRSVADFEYELGMAGMNRQISNGALETLMLPPSKELQFISSSFVREISGLGGDVSSLVSPSVLALVRARHKASK